MIGLKVRYSRGIPKSPRVVCSNESSDPKHERSRFRSGSVLPVVISVMRVQRSRLISLLAATTLILSGCGRSYHIKGRVISLPQLQSAAGFIVEFTGKDFPKGGSSVNE